MLRASVLVLAIFSGVVIQAQETVEKPETGQKPETVQKPNDPLATRKPDQPSGDARLGELKTLDGHFAFAVPSNPAQWYARAEALRRRVAVATGLWPMPEKTPIEPVIHGKVTRDGFTVERVYFESLPGHFVTGLLFRPEQADNAETSRQKFPAVLSPHGHGGRNQQLSDGELASQLASGSEHFAASGRTPKLARCAQLARMGCVTFIFDMVGYGDSMQLSYELAHRHAKPRPEERRAEDKQTDSKDGADESWVFFSPEADLRLQSIMGLQTWNAIRALDFLASLPDVDPERLAVTGGSGGGTQSILLGAMDDRIKVSFPNGMVSTSMQGGCYCENCNLLRIDTGNVELAALFAPRPQAMTAADDWTRDMMTDGYPQLQELYAMIGDQADVYCRPMLHFKHNYNYVTRATMYQWMNRHLNLGLDDPVVEQDFKPLTEDELAVWNEQHPAPETSGVDHEREILNWMDEQSRTQIDALEPGDEASLAKYREVVGGAWSVIFDSRLPTQRVRFDNTGDTAIDGMRVHRGMILDSSRGAELPTWIVKNSESTAVLDDRSRVVVWTAASGKAEAIKGSAQDRPSLKEMIASGLTVVIPDLLGQGELALKEQLDSSDSSARQRLIDDEREYSAFTFGYNRTLVAERTADLLAVIGWAKSNSPAEVRLLATAGSAAWAAPAAAIAGAALDDAAIDTGGFRYAAVDHYSNTNFVPGAVKYGDLPAVLSLRAPHTMTLLGESELPAVVRSVYQASSAEPPMMATQFDAWVRSR